MATGLIIIENITDLASLILVSVTVFLGLRIVRMSREIEVVALKGGRAPYYIVLGVVFLGLNRLMDFLAEPFLNPLLGEEISLTLDDVPGALAALFIFLGLRSMYLLYRKASTNKEHDLSAEDLWVGNSEGNVHSESGINDQTQE